MANVKVDTSGIDKLTRRMRVVQSIASGLLTASIRAGLDEIGVKIVAELQKESPVADSSKPDFHKNSKFYTDATHLRDSWKWKLNVKGTIIEGFAYVPQRLENLVDLLQAGSPRHPIPAKPGGVLSFYVRSGGGWELVYAKYIADHPGFRPNKFVDRARIKSEKHIAGVRKIFQDEINRIMVGK